MQVIPAINCQDIDCVSEKVRLVERFFPFGKGWVQLDVADGVFTFNKTWGDPSAWRKFQTNLNLEVHLMVEKPERAIEEWLQIGARRIVVHIEAVQDEDFILELCKAYSAEVMLALNPETPVESLKLYFEKFNEFQILAVNPGMAGQHFLPTVLDKVRFIRESYSRAIIEVDGGINLETAQQCVNAGAHILAAASYIFESENPSRAYNTLASLE